MAAQDLDLPGVSCRTYPSTA